MKTFYLKKLPYLSFLLTLFVVSACETEYYEGEQRLVIEGIAQRNGAPLSNVKIKVYPTYETANTGQITPVENAYQKIDQAIADTKTDRNGKISLSIPMHYETNNYVISISVNNQEKYYGYISHLNTINYYCNLGTIQF